MTYILCRNKVQNFKKWKAVFDSHTQSHKQAGLYLKNMWCDVKDSNNVFFNFEVADIDTAFEYINSTESAKAVEVSGVIEGEYHFIEDV